MFDSTAGNSAVDDFAVDALGTTTSCHPKTSLCRILLAGVRQHKADVLDLSAVKLSCWQTVADLLTLSDV